MATRQTAAYNFTSEFLLARSGCVEIRADRLARFGRYGPAVDDASPLIRYEPANFWDDNVSQDVNLPVRSTCRRRVFQGTGR